jgi:hypothetical protein
VRRRLLWTGGFLALAGGAAALIVAFPSPGSRPEDKTSPGGTLVPQDKPIKFAPQQKEMLALAQQFVSTAVARKHVEDSWELVCPSMKHGYTRTTWAKGDIPVVPFAFVFGKWRLSYSFQTEVDLQVALFAKRQAHIPPIVFDLTLQPCGKADKDSGKQWLVASFIPTPSATGDYPSSGTTRQANPFAIGTKNPKPLPHHASGAWLLIPGGIVGGMLFLVLGFLGLRSIRGKRAYAAYVRERQISSSRPS